MEILRVAQVRIQNLTFTINEVDTVENDKNVLGRTYYNTLNIYILKDLPTDNFKRILIHELSHATNYAYGFSHVHHTEETMCDFVSVYAEQIVAMADVYVRGRSQ